MRSETDFADPSPWTRPRFVLAAAFLGMVAVLGVAVALFHHGKDTSGGAPPPNAIAPSGSVAADVPAGPDASALPTAVPTQAPADVSWQLVGQGSVPVSKTAGPRTVIGGVAAGFAHTPEGALLAAAQLAERAAFSSGRASWEPTVQHSFVPGPDRDRLLANLRSVPAQQAAPGKVSPLIGFEYQAYTPDTAVIGLVYRAPDATPPTYHVVTTTMQWRDGDWRMVPPPGGSWLSVNRQATDLTGVIEWEAR